MKKYLRNKIRDEIICAQVRLKFSYDNLIISDCLDLLKKDYSKKIIIDINSSTLYYNDAYWRHYVKCNHQKIIKILQNIDSNNYRDIVDGLGGKLIKYETIIRGTGQPGLPYSNRRKARKRFQRALVSPPDHPRYISEIAPLRGSND